MDPRPIRLGLTGDVGSGKSRIRSWLAERGAATLDADQVAHGCLQRPEVLREVIVTFGPGVLDAEGRVDRAALAGIVFAEPEQLRRLEAILHPRVLADTEAWMASAEADLLVVEAVKLVGSVMQSRLDRLWLVLCDEPVRRLRLRDRRWSEAEISARIAAAPPLAPRLAAADRVIDNSGSWTVTERQLEQALRRLLRREGDLSRRAVLSYSSRDRSE